MAVTVYPITPVPKPRMTRRDKWMERECVMRYRAFADECRLRNVRLTESGYHVICVMPMPASWSQRKRSEMRGNPHQQKPDKDNLEKALLDAIYDDDSHVWDGRLTKIWGDRGAIVVIDNPVDQQQLAEWASYADDKK